MQSQTLMHLFICMQSERTSHLSDNAYFIWLCTLHTHTHHLLSRDENSAWELQLTRNHTVAHGNMWIWLHDSLSSRNGNKSVLLTLPKHATRRWTRNILFQVNGRWWWGQSDCVQKCWTHTETCRMTPHLVFKQQVDSITRCASVRMYTCFLSHLPGLCMNFCSRALTSS